MQVNIARPRGEFKSVGNAIDDKKPATVYPKVTVRLSQELRDAVDDIANATGAKSPSQVIRQAVVIYHSLLTHLNEGHEPCILLDGEPFENRIKLFEKDEE